MSELKEKSWTWFMKYNGNPVFLVLSNHVIVSRLTVVDVERHELASRAGTRYSNKNDTKRINFT